MEFLKDVLGEELFNQVAEKLNGNEKIRIANVADGSFIPKEKFDTERNNAKALKTQIEELNSKIGTMQNDSDALNAMRVQLQAMQNDITAKDEAMKKQELRYSIREAVRDSKAKNADIVCRMIDESKISIVDGKLTGLSDQIEALQKSDGYLFNEQTGSKGGFEPKGTPNGGAVSIDSAVNDSIRKAAGR